MNQNSENIKKNPHKVPPVFISWHRKEYIRMIKEYAKRKVRLTITLITSLVFLKNLKWYPDFLLQKSGIALLSSRTATLYRIIDLIESFEGDVAECGVYRGNTLLGMAVKILRRDSNIRIFGLDSFEGLPDPSIEDRLKDGKMYEGALKGMFSDTSYNELLMKISLWGFSDNVRLVKGFFNNTLEQLSDRKFQLVHIDVDLYQSYKECLNFFYPRLVPGGYIVLDEYGHENTFPGAKKAVEEFFSDKPEKPQYYDNEKENSRRYFIVKQI